MALPDISHISDLSLKHWLKIHELPHSVNTNEHLIALLDRLIKTQKLTREALVEAILEIEETGSKNIFLRSVKDRSAIKNQKNFLRHLRSSGLGRYKTERRTIKYPRSPSLNYVQWYEQSPPQIRVKFSETHIEPIVDYERRRFEDERFTKFVVIIAEPDSGLVQIRMDKPLKIHPHKDDHGNSKSYLYEGYYLEKAARILGSELTAYDLRGVSKYLADMVPRIIRLPWEKVRTGANSRQTYSSEADIRDDPAHEAAKTADGNNWTYEDLNFYWLPDPSEKKLARELYMRMRSQDGMLTFLADCLENEVNYAISRVKEARKAIP